MSNKMINLMRDYETCRNIYKIEGAPVLGELLNEHLGLNGSTINRPHAIVDVLVQQNYCSREDAEDLVYTNIDPLLSKCWADREVVPSSDCSCGSTEPTIHTDWCNALRKAYCKGCAGCTIPCGKAEK